MSVVLRWKETGRIEREDGSGRPKGSKPTQDAMLEKLCLKASTAELNPIELEKLWSQVKHLQRSERATSMAGIIKVAKKVWRAITPEYLENLYESMLRRRAAVIAAGVRHTKY